MRPGRRTVTLLRRGVTSEDDYGNDVRVDTEVDLHGCWTHPRMSAEGSVDAPQQVISGQWLYAPTAEPITPQDAIRDGDTTYEIDGEPSVWFNRRGRPRLQQVALTKVTG